MSKENADRVLQVAMELGITGHKELANFMGQMQVESANFNHFEENLNYSPERFLSVFKGRNGLETIDEARKIVAGGPEAVGDAVYGGEWGKGIGNTKPGYGYTYRGRGFTQLTGRDNYHTTGSRLGFELVNHPDEAANPETAARIAGDTWKRMVVARGDQLDVFKATRDINGGTNGLAAREAAAAAWERKLDAGYRPGQPDPTAEHPAAADRRQLQAGLNALGYTDARGRPLAVDGRDGPGTRAATEAFQHDHDLTPDGIAGPRTRAALTATLADAQTAPAASTTPPFAAWPTTTALPSTAGTPSSRVGQTAIDHALWKNAGTSALPSASSIPAATILAANGQAAAPTAAELWSVVAARAPTAAPAASSVITVPAAGPALGPR